MILNNQVINYSLKNLKHLQAIKLQARFLMQFEKFFYEKHNFTLTLFNTV